MDKSLTQRTRDTGRFTEIITYSYDLEMLNRATDKLNGANQHPAHKRTGMFSRREDFESSTIKLASQLSSEFQIACDFALEGFDNDRFRKVMHRNNMRLSGVGNAIRVNGSFEAGSSFSTRDLSPAVRHFVNDYCRVIELLTKILVEKIWPGDVPTDIFIGTQRRIKSFNQVLEEIERRNIAISIDSNFFKKLYDDLWNDYKHDRETAGITVSGWHTNNTKLVSKPYLCVASSKRFNGMPVVDFMDLLIKKLNELLDYLD